MGGGPPDFLRLANTMGLVRVPDEAEEEEETVLVQHLRHLEDGQQYYMRFAGQRNSIPASGKSRHTSRSGEKTRPASMVKAIAADTQTSAGKSSGAAYAGTRYGQCNRKKVVLAFVAESTAATTVDSLRRTAQTHGWKLYRRNGSSISPWASMSPLQRAVARPAVMRWVA